MTPEEKSTPPISPPVWKDGLYCLLTALCFLALISLTGLIYMFIESKLPKALQASLGFFEYLFILQAPSVIPIFHEAQKKGRFPNFKHLLVIANLSLFIWLLFTIVKSGSALAQLLGVVIFTISIGVAFSPVIVFFTFRGRRGLPSRAA